jgi:hypothetical protein
MDNNTKILPKLQNMKLNRPGLNNPDIVFDDEEIDLTTHS